MVSPSYLNRNRRRLRYRSGFSRCQEQASTACWILAALLFATCIVFIILGDRTLAWHSLEFSHGERDRVLALRARRRRSAHAHARNATGVDGGPLRRKPRHYPRPQPGLRFDHFLLTSPGCVTGHKLAGGSYRGHTAAQCADRCDKRKDCVAFQLGVPHGGGSARRDSAETLFFRSERAALHTATGTGPDPHSCWVLRNSHDRPSTRRARANCRSGGTR